MARREYELWKPGANARNVINIANAICADYKQQGYDLTLRQLYYQFVARDHLPNTPQSYKRLGDIVNRARLAGLMDWNYIVDRTRGLKGTSHWDTPSEVIDSAAESYRLDKWADQDVRVEVWVEKEALAGIVQRAAAQWDVNWFSCRGYVSQSELWRAGARRHLRYLQGEQRVVILHLGDHDPSGIDMTRDIERRVQRFAYTEWARENGYDLDLDMDEADLTVQLERIAEFIGDELPNFWGEHPIEVRRIALNMDQVRTYNPPPNPAKITDSRATGYIKKHGTKSWELDALDPNVLASLIDEHIGQEVDIERYEAIQATEEAQRATLANIARAYPEIEAQYGPDAEGDDDE